MNTVNSQALTTRPIRYCKLLTKLVLAFAAIVSSNNPAQALEFNFTFSDNTPLEVRAVFWAAGDAWSKQLTDDVTVNIFVDYGTLPTNALAGTRPGMIRVAYSEFQTKLRQDKSSQDSSKYVSQNYDDAQVLSFLPNGTNFKYLKKAYKAINNSWSTGVANGNTVWLTRANAKALGLINQNNSDYNNIDASIRISNIASWHYYTIVAPPIGQYDLLTVATHEIGHTLGFVSGVDAFEFLSGGGNLTDQNLEYVTPMDLLRYSKQSATQGISDWTTGETFFSLDGGDRNLGNFSRGANTDGFQAGHWEHGESQGAMDPLVKTGERWGISVLDRQLLDVIGWDYGTQLSKNMAAVMLSINWNTSNPDLSLVENLLKAHLSIEMEKLGQERDVIRNWDPVLWSQLKAIGDEAFQKRQQGIQETLKKIRDERYEPNRRMEEALRGVTNHLAALATLTGNYKQKLQPPMTAQIIDGLNGSPENLKEKLKHISLLQIKTLVAKVKDASQSQRYQWSKNIKEALKLLYQEINNNQDPSQIELITAQAKLLSAAIPDGGIGWSSGSYSWRFWQTGDTRSSFEKTGEFTFHTSAAPETDVVPEPAWTKGMLGLLGVFGIGSLLKGRGKKSRASVSK